MQRNVGIGAAILIVIVGLGFLFIQQQGSQKNPLETNTSPNFSPSYTGAPTASPVAASQNAGQESSQSGNIVTMADGLKIQDITVGTGEEAATGSTVTVNYLGTLENGTKFDSSYDRNQPFSVQIGVGQVIKGWDEGIPGMKVGGKRKLIIPPELGYGAQAAGTIPPNSTLIFEVELLGVK